MVKSWRLSYFIFINVLVAQLLWGTVQFADLWESLTMFEVVGPIIICGGACLLVWLKNRPVQYGNVISENGFSEFQIFQISKRNRQNDFKVVMWCTFDC